jgi:hypothetical protein
MQPFYLDTLKLVEPLKPIVFDEKPELRRE